MVWDKRVKNKMTPDTVILKTTIWNHTDILTKKSCPNNECYVVRVRENNKTSIILLCPICKRNMGYEQ